MLKFEKDKVLLLKTLRDFVKEAMSVDPLMEEDTAEFLADLSDRRNVRKLKKIKKALESWIDELKDATNENCITTGNQ